MPSIPTKITFGEAATTRVSEDIISLLKAHRIHFYGMASTGSRASKRERLKEVQRILQDLSWTNEYTLEMTRWSDRRLWDLWAVIPPFYKKIRSSLARYLERSPLIKLAECAE